MSITPCKLFLLFVLFSPLSVFSQTHTAKPSAGSASTTSKGNYISHEISKTGRGDNGIFKDTLNGKIEKTDAHNAKGMQYQDIHITLDEGDVLCTNLNAFDFKASLALFKTTNGKLQPVKTVNVSDEIGEHKFKLIYKADESSSYTLRIQCKEKILPSEDGSYSGYNVNTTIATPTSGKYSGDSTFCSRVQFLIRQEATEFMQVLGPVVDTDMDYLDKKKISTINYQSTFNLYDNKDIAMHISINFEQKYGKYDLMVTYNTKEAAKDYYDRLLAALKSCLGDAYKGAVDNSFGNDEAYQFTNGEDYYHSITILWDSQYSYVHLMM